MTAPALKDVRGRRSLGPRGDKKTRTVLLVRAAGLPQVIRPQPSRRIARHCGQHNRRRQLGGVSDEAVKPNDWR